MADVDYEDLDDGYRQLKRSPRWLNIAGALTSVALVIGVGVWGYRIAVRDVMGIPIVRALEGPMRMAPQNPGGDIADHQGLSVNDVAALGVATPVPDSLVLAPRGGELTEEDVAGLAVETAQVTAAAVADTSPLTSVAPIADDVSIVTQPSDLNQNVLDLADQLASGAAPLQAPEELVLASAPVAGGLGASLQPKARPGQRAAAPAAVPDATVEAALAVAALEIDPATLEAGTRLVQLGAYDSQDQARAEWDKLYGRFSELLSGKARVIQAAQSGGRTFFRLRAHGFDSEDDARRFCSALQAENAACIPVAQR